MCVCVCVGVRVCAHTCAWAYIYTHTNAHVYGCTHTRVYTCMCIYPTHCVTLTNAALYHNKLIQFLQINIISTVSCNYGFHFYLFRVSVSLCYFALAVNSGNLAGDVHLNFFLGALVEFPAYLITVYLLDKRFGRRSLLSLTMVVAGSACFISSFPFVYGGPGKILKHF